jgi:uncharacterized repeat protein (TIGR03803 family)
MRSRNLSIGLTAVALVALTVLGTATRAAAQQEKALHSFNSNGKDGFTPYASLILDTAGNLYGTTQYGGSYGAYGGGTVFELMPEEAGGWTERVLHSFNGNLDSTDGSQPRAGLIFDAAGNLYGTTYKGGVHGYGTAFELTRTTGGNWTEKILHNFNDDGKDAYNPDTSLTFDAAGNLYGTTQYGGAYNFGAVFELILQAGGNWTEKILHNFDSNLKDGYEPLAGVIFVAGNLYGTTQYGGASGNGAVFELTPQTGGGWAEKILHSFNKNGQDGLVPIAGLVSDSSGNLYGTHPCRCC